MALAVGDLAPEFELPGIAGEIPEIGDAGKTTWHLKEFLGNPVVLVFYPGDGTPVCTRQLNSYTQDITQFSELGAQVLAISPQSVGSHERFADKQGGFGFPLLADEERTVGRSYGIVGPLGFYRRSIFVIDASGHISYVRRSVAGLTFEPTDALLAAVTNQD